MILLEAQSSTRLPWWVAQRTPLVVGAGALAAVLFFVVMVAGTGSPIRMPITPPLVPMLAAIGAVLLVLTADRLGASFRTRAAVAVGCGVGMLSGSLLAVPHTVLFVVVWIGSLVTGGEGPFDVAPSWPATAAYGADVVAVLLLGVWTLVERRRLRGRCLGCGRLDSRPGAGPRRSLPRLAVLTVAASLPYGGLKLAWALGWTGGLTGAAFRDVSFTSPGFGDTVVLTLVSVGVAVTMGARVGGRRIRPVLGGVGVLGSLMLLPVAVVGVVSLLLVALGQRTIDESEIAAWVFVLVYGGFLVWGVSLAALTAGYLRATRPACARHVLATDPASR